MSKRVLSLVACVMLAGCLRAFDPLALPDGAEVVGPADAGGGQTVTLRNQPPDMTLGAGRSGRDVFTTNLYEPILKARCVFCHGYQDGAGPGFLRPDPYDSIISY